MKRRLLGPYLGCASGLQCLADSAPASGARTRTARPSPPPPLPQRSCAAHSAPHPDHQRRARRARRRGRRRRLAPAAQALAGPPPRSRRLPPPPVADTGKARELTGRGSCGGFSSGFAPAARARRCRAGPDLPWPRSRRLSLVGRHRQSGTEDLPGEWRRGGGGGGCRGAYSGRARGPVR